MITHRHAACLLAALSIYLAASLSPLTAASAAAAGCPAVDAVAVPGTTQTSPDADPGKPVGVLGAILEPLKRRAKLRISTYYTPYPATIIGGTDGVGYAASKTAGIDSTNAHLKAVAARCPKTVFLLTGFSQGADVAGDVAAAIGSLVWA